MLWPNHLPFTDGSFWAGKSHGENSTASKFNLPPFAESVSFPYRPGRDEQFAEPTAESAAAFYEALFDKHELIGYENDVSLTCIVKKKHT